MTQKERTFFIDNYSTDTAYRIIDTIESIDEQIKIGADTPDLKRGLNIARILLMHNFRRRVR